MLFRRASFVAVLAALLMAFTVPVEVQAQEADPTFDDLLAALNNTDAAVEDLEAREDISAQEVRAVRAEDLVEGTEVEVEALNSAISENEEGIAALRSALDENEGVKEALDNNDVATSDVLAVEDTGGEVIVYYQPQQE